MVKAFCVYAYMKPKIYIHSVTVSQDDLDELMHVNNVKYLNYLQEAAILHWYSSVPGSISESLRWVVKKHEIEYFKAAFLNDELKIKTWVDSFSGVSSDRHYEIYRNDQLIVKARTLWVAIDPITLRPKRLPEDIQQIYFEE